jgi:hypothetical protein
MGSQFPWIQYYNLDRNHLEEENLVRLNQLRNQFGPNIDVQSDDFKNIMTRAFNIYQSYPYNNLRSWRSINNSQNEINQVQVLEIINLDVSGGGWVNWYYFRPDSNNYVIACLPSFENSNISIHSVMNNPLIIDNSDNNNNIVSNIPQT